MFMLTQQQKYNCFHMRKVKLFFTYHYLSYSSRLTTQKVTVRSDSYTPTRGPILLQRLNFAITFLCIAIDTYVIEFRDLRIKTTYRGTAELSYITFCIYFSNIFHPLFQVSLWCMSVIQIHGLLPYCPSLKII